MKSLLTAAILFIYTFSVSSGKNLPAFIKKCKRNDPGLSDCVKDAMLGLQPQLAEGIPSLKIPTLDPFTLKSASLATDYAIGTFSNIKFLHANDFVVKYLKIDLDNPTIWMNVTYPYLDMNCDYSADGKLLNIAFHGEGTFVANFTNTNLTSVIHGSKSKKNGQEYITWKSSETKILEDSMEYFYLSDLFRNNPELTERLHQVIRENQSVLTPDVIPLVGEIFAKVFVSIFNGPFTLFSLNELFD